MRVVFRVDASVLIGTGHVVRCLTLAKGLSGSGAECYFVMRRLDGDMIVAVEDAGFPVFTMAVPNGERHDSGDLAHSGWLGVDWAADAEETILAIAALDSIDWIIVDHYALDARWEQLLRRSAQGLMAIDDIADRKHDSDILLDQNLQSADNRYAGLISEHTTQLIGTRYALVNPDFSNQRQKLAVRNQNVLGRVFVYLGGVDLPGFTLRALKAIETLWSGSVKVDVVVGKLNPHYNDITEWCLSHDWVTLHYGSNVMSELMAASDIAIGAGGSTSWERCCLSLPSIVVALADNQASGGRALGASGAALYLGMVDAVDDDVLCAALQLLGENSGLRTHMANTAGSLVDGKGMGRVISYLWGEKIKLRRATTADCEKVWQWRNAEETRKHSHNPLPVTLEEHRNWFTGVLESSDRDLLIGEIEGKPAGVIRFDHDENVCTVSIYLVPGRAGRGEGSQLLRAASKWLTEFRPATVAVNAEIFYENAASRSTFVEAGYHPFVATLRYAL